MNGVYLGSVPSQAQILSGTYFDMASSARSSGGRIRRLQPSTALQVEIFIDVQSCAAAGLICGKTSTFATTIGLLDHQAAVDFNATIFAWAAATGQAPDASLVGSFTSAYFGAPPTLVPAALAAQTPWYVMLIAAVLSYYVAFWIMRKVDGPTCGGDNFVCGCCNWARRLFSGQAPCCG